MPKARTGRTPKATARVDSVRPPPDLPDASPFERMTELARRLLGVPKDEAIPPKKKRPKGKHG